MRRAPKSLCPWKGPFERRNSSRRSALELAADAVRCEKLPHCSGYLRAVRLDGEVACVEEADLRIRDVFSKRLGPRGNEERIVLAPDSQQRRLRLAEILLELRIKLHVRCIVQEQIELNVFVSGTLQQRGIQGVRFGRNDVGIGYAVRVLPARCIEIQDVVVNHLSVLG